MLIFVCRQYITVGVRMTSSSFSMQPLTAQNKPPNSAPPTALRRLLPLREDPAHDNLWLANRTMSILEHGSRTHNLYAFLSRLFPNAVLAVRSNFHAYDIANLPTDRTQAAFIFSFMEILGKNKTAQWPCLPALSAEDALVLSGRFEKISSDGLVIATLALFFKIVEDPRNAAARLYKTQIPLVAGATTAEPRPPAAVLGLPPSTPAI